MKPVLIIEIVSALVALGALATLVVQAVRAKLKSGRGPVYHARYSGQTLERQRPGAPCILPEAVLAAL